MKSNLLFQYQNHTYTLLHPFLINGVEVSESICGNGEPFRYGRVASSKLTFKVYTDYLPGQTYLDVIRNCDYFRWACQMMNEDHYTVRDIYYVDNIDIHGNVATITAYNIINQLEVSAYAFIQSYASATQGITIANFLNALMDWWKNNYPIKGDVRLLYITDGTVPYQYIYPQKMDLSNVEDITVREVLSYALELMNAYVISRNNDLYVKTLNYRSTPITVDKTKYVSADLGYQPIPKPNCFVWGSSDGMGLTYISFIQADGTDVEIRNYDQSTRVFEQTENGYIRRQIYYLEANPFVDYAANKASSYRMTHLADMLVHDAPDYYAGEVVLLNDFGWDIGYQLLVDGKLMYIMEKTITPSGVVFRSNGSMDRNFQENRKGWVILVFKQPQS